MPRARLARSRCRTGSSPVRVCHVRRGGVLVKLVGGIVGLGVLAGGGYWLSTMGPDRGVQQAAADVVPVSVRSFDITTLATGELEAKNKIELRSQLDAQSTIVSVVPEGSRVQKGDLLVELNSDVMRESIDQQVLEVQEAELSLKSAEAEFRIQQSENDSKVRAAQLAIDLADLALKQWRDGDHSLTLTQNKLEVERAERDLKRLKEKFENSKRLHKEQFISSDELQRDEIAMLEAEAAAMTAMKQQEIYLSYQFPRDQRQKESDVEEAKAELARVEEENGVNLENKRAAADNRREALRLRQEKLAELQDQLAKTKIHAPQPGLVVYASSLNRDDWRNQQEGPISIGRAVRQNDLIIVLPDTSEMSASVRVHESLAGRVRPGQPATVSIDAIGESVRGVVESIGVLAEGGGWRDPNRREYTVKIALQPDPEQAARLKPAMRCESRIVLGSVNDSMAVPVQAVFNEGPIRFVYVPENGRYTRRPVQVARRSDTYAEVTAGLAPGDRVLLRQPSAGEILAQPWDPVALRAAGYDAPDTPDPEGRDPAPVQAASAQ